MRASKTGLDVAASVQRSRIAIRMLEDSLGSAQSFAANLPYYYFLAENGNEAALSFVARLSKSFPRSGKFGDLDVRRVTFSVEPGPDGGRQLVLRQMPLVMDEPDADEKAASHRAGEEREGLRNAILRHATRTRPNGWTSGRSQRPINCPSWSRSPWSRTTRTPRRSQEEITRIINLPAVTVQPVWQTTAQIPGGPGGPGGPPIQLRR